jgi:hypothetical protein
MNVEVRHQIFERHRLPHVLAIAHNMEIRFSEVDDSPTVCRRDIRVSDIPFVRNFPVEHLSTARYLVDFKRNPPGYLSKRLTNSVTGDASADGEEAGSKCAHTHPAIGAQSSAGHHDTSLAAAASETGDLEIPDPGKPRPTIASSSKASHESQPTPPPSAQPLPNRTLTA